MAVTKGQPATIDEYIVQFPEDVQEKLHQVRAVIREAAPDAEERISYGIPSYHYHGPLIYFGGAKNHIGIYPKTEQMMAIEGLSEYKGTKGSVHFPLNEPIPTELLRKIVQVRLEENQAKSSSRSKKSV